MRKILFQALAALVASQLWAAQQPLTEISVKQSNKGLREAVNAQVVAPAQDNFTQIWEALNGSPWLAQTTAPSIHNVFWLDTTGAPPTIKYWDGDSWEVAAAGGDGTYTLPTASAETKGGVKIGARLTMTGEVLSADVQTTDISGKEDSLGNPSTDGYVLSSTTAGVRSWVEMLAGGLMIYPGAGVPVSTGTAWGASITLGTGVPAALGHAPDTTDGFLLANTYLADPLISWDTATITETVDSPVTGTNKIGVKSGVFQSYDANMILWPSAISATEVGYLDGLGGALTTLLGAKRSIVDEREPIGWHIKDADVVTVVADGKQGAVIPESMNGMVLIGVTCKVDDLNSAASGNTTVVLRRVRGATAVDMTSTGVTIAYNEYAASDEAVDTANSDVSPGDKIFPDVNTVTTPAQKGLGCTADFARP